MRDSRIARHVRAGCFVCHGGMAQWEAKNAQGVAARHHDATGHACWVEGRADKKKKKKIDVEKSKPPV